MFIGLDICWLFLIGEGIDVWVFIKIVILSVYKVGVYYICLWL